MDCSPPGSSVLGILQARILEWVASVCPALLQSFHVTFLKYDSRLVLYHCAAIVGAVNTKDP